MPPVVARGRQRAPPAGRRWVAPVRRRLTHACSIYPEIGRLRASRPMRSRLVAPRPRPQRRRRRRSLQPQRPVGLLRAAACSRRRAGPRAAPRRLASHRRRRIRRPPRRPLPTSETPRSSFSPGCCSAARSRGTSTCSGATSTCGRSTGRWCGRRPARSVVGCRRRRTKFGELDAMYPLRTAARASSDARLSASPALGDQPRKLERRPTM